MTTALSLARSLFICAARSPSGLLCTEHHAPEDTEHKAGGYEDRAIETWPRCACDMPTRPGFHSVSACGLAEEFTEGAAHFKGSREEE